MTKEVTCCFTGPRPQRLPSGGNESSPEIVELKKALRSSIKEAYSDGFRCFMSGMADGFDLMAAEAVLELKEELSNDICVVAVFPSPKSRTNHSFETRRRIENIVGKASLVIYVQDRYSFGCELRRNIYMVDSSWRIIGFYDGCSRGTAHCWKYAESSGLETVNLYHGEIFQ